MTFSVSDLGLFTVSTVSVTKVAVQLTWICILFMFIFLCGWTEVKKKYDGLNDMLNSSTCHTFEESNSSGSNNLGDWNVYVDKYITSFVCSIVVQKCWKCCFLGRNCFPGTWPVSSCHVLLMYISVPCFSFDCYSQSQNDSPDLDFVYADADTYTSEIAGDYHQILISANMFSSCLCCSFSFNRSSGIKFKE